MITILQKLAVVLEKNANFFAKFFGPWSWSFPGKEQYFSANKKSANLQFRK
jgi:hypothetical protein